MFNHTTEYAVRAIIAIARLPAGEFILARELGEALDLPSHYLAKVLQQLSRRRILKSTRGRTGGFRLARPAASITLREVVEPFEDLDKTSECIIGLSVCNDKVACPLHEFWKEVRERYTRELENKTVADLASYEDIRESLQGGPGLPLKHKTPKAFVKKSTRKKSARKKRARSARR